MTSPMPTTPSSTGGYVSNEVIALQLRHLETTVSTMSTNLVAELQLLRVEMVRRDVYDEQRRADQAKLTLLEQELKENRQRKWLIWLAVAGAGIALGRDLLVAMIQAGGAG